MPTPRVTSPRPTFEEKIGKEKQRERERDRKRERERERNRETEKQRRKDRESVQKSGRGDIIATNITGAIVPTPRVTSPRPIFEGKREIERNREKQREREISRERSETEKERQRERPEIGAGVGMTSLPPASPERANAEGDIATTDLRRKEREKQRERER